MGRTAYSDTFDCRNHIAGHRHVFIPIRNIALRDGAANLHHWDRRHPGYCRDRRRRPKRVCKRIQVNNRGIFLVLTIVFWNLLLNWISFRFKFFERLLSPPPLPLVCHGKMNYKNMRQEFITPDELKSQLRQHGISELKDVKRACLEANGELSVITYDPPAADINSKSRAKSV